MKKFIPTIENDTTVDEKWTQIKNTMDRYPTGDKETDEKILSTLSNQL